MKKSLLLLPFLISSVCANDRTFDPKKFMFNTVPKTAKKFAHNTITVTAYGIPKLITLNNDPIVSYPRLMMGINPLIPNPLLIVLALGMVVQVSGPKLPCFMFLEHGLPSFVEHGWPALTGFRKGERRILIGDANIPFVTNHDINDIAVAGSIAAGFTALGDGKFSPSRMAHAASKAAATKFVENKIIDAAQILNDKLRLVDQDSWRGAVVTGAGHFAAEYIANATVAKFISWPCIYADDGSKGIYPDDFYLRKK